MKTINQPLYTISQLNAEARELLEKNLKSLWLIGEISNLARPASGHLYLTLKDQFAQVRCAFFKNSAKKLSFSLANGQQVLVQASVSLYEARGDFQLIITHMEPAGDGALQLAFEQLKKKLQTLGLFDLSHKKALPPFIQTVGVVTSRTGAAIRDILHVLARRSPNIEVIIYPTAVQGAAAAQQIAEAIETANRRGECDILLVARGGGSLEDLWAFNEEPVAHAIFNSKIPIVTGIGHEIDFTIADFVADLRAPTPSAAAELISADIKNFLQQLAQLFYRLSHAQLTSLRRTEHQLTTLTKRLRDPRAELKNTMQQLTTMQRQLTLSLQHHLKRKAHQLQHTLLSLMRHTPQSKITSLIQCNKAHGHKLMLAGQHTLALKKNQFQHLSQQLESISPLQILHRGYAIVTDASSNSLISQSTAVSVGQKINIKLSKGKVLARIERKTDD